MLAWIRTLWPYNLWANRKLWGCLMSLSEADYKRPTNYSHGSIESQVVHLARAEAVWYARLHGLPRPEFTAADFPDRAALRAEWDGIQARWSDYIAALTEAELGETFVAVRASGARHTHTVAEAVLHLVNHATDHRAQILVRVADLSGPTFDQDLILYLRETRAGNMPTQ